MDKKTYAETVLQEVYRRTTAGDLAWEVTDTYLYAEPVPLIKVIIRFEDCGPDAATWLQMWIDHPVGRAHTSVTAPADPLARYTENVAAGETLEMIDAVFQKVLLATRRKQFEETMAKLTRT